MRGVMFSCIMFGILVASAHARSVRFLPHIQDYDVEATNENHILALERDVTDLTDLSAPMLIRLLDLTDDEGSQRHMDLERQHAGGAAMKLTQYEKDMYQMAFLHLLHFSGINDLKVYKTNKPRMFADSGGKIASEYFPLKKSFDRDLYKKHSKNVLSDRSKLTSFSAKLFTFLPPLQLVGEGMDQYNDLALKAINAESCATDVPSLEQIEKIAAGVSTADLVKSIRTRYATILDSTSPDKIKAVEDRITEMVANMDYTWKRGDGADGKISSCEYVRAYLSDHPKSDLGSVPLTEEAEREFTELQKTSGSVKFEQFQSYLKKKFQSSFKDSDPVDLKAWFILADLSGYFGTDAKAAPTSPTVSGNVGGELDACEWRLFYSALKRTEQAWQIDNMWPETEVDPSFQHQRHMGYVDFERLLKAVDTGNEIKGVDKYDISILTQNDATQLEEVPTLAEILFANIATTADHNASDLDKVLDLPTRQAYLDKTISVLTLKNYLKQLCAGLSSDSEKELLRQVEDAVRDYDTSNDKTLSWAEFQGAINGFATLVHGVAPKDIAGFEEQQSLGTELTQPQFLGTMLLLMNYGSNANEDGKLDATVSTSSITFAQFANQKLTGGDEKHQAFKAKYFSG